MARRCITNKIGQSEPVSRILSSALRIAEAEWRSFLWVSTYAETLATYPGVFQGKNISSITTRMLLPFLGDGRPPAFSGFLLYLVLHRMGFTELPMLPSGLVRSYRTFSPLPPKKQALERRCLFCGTFRSLAAPPCYGASCPAVFGLSSILPNNFCKTATARFTLTESFESLFSKYTGGRSSFIVCCGIPTCIGRESSERSLSLSSRHGAREDIHWNRAPIRPAPSPPYNSLLFAVLQPGSACNIRSGSIRQPP
jgi:hypothetical protein